jgi:hypothetical protein
MRRVLQRTQHRLLLAALTGFGAASGAGCRAREACLGAACSAACPRDSSPGGDGRCACDRGDVLVLGACVPPTVADGYCGQAAKVGADGRCAFPTCRGSEVADVDTGCTGVGAATRGGRSCAGGSLVLEGGRFACVPSDAACPPGSRAAQQAPKRGDGGASRPTSCEYSLACPAGSLPEGRGCRPIVSRARGFGEGTRTGGGASTVVDVGAWAALVLGYDGAQGSADLCRPLQAHPSLFDLNPGDSSTVAVRVVLSFPGQDMSGAYASVTVRAIDARVLQSVAAGLATRATAALIEPLRGLGGQASSSRVEVEVRCTISSL